MPSLAERLIAAYFARTVKKGSLTVTYASGRVQALGDGTGEAVAIRFGDAGAERALVLDPALKFGETYMDGRLIVETGSLYDFIAVMKVNGYRHTLPLALKIAGLAPHLVRWLHNVARAGAERRQVAHHYDLDARLFRLFLDADWQYSCAYYERGDEDLEEAQLAKKRHVTAKLWPRAGDKVLDIGCGWGGMAFYIAELTGAHVTGITLSKEQVAIARQRARARGLEHLTEFRLQNYRDVEGSFDRIVSIGMLEHVGKGNYHVMFSRAAQLLKKEGVMVVHAIARPKPVPSQGRFNDKYIFPGGYIPALSEVLPAIEKAGFLVKDIELLPMHYAYTLKAWRERFYANWDKAAAIYDERFCRMWDIYLSTSESAFRHDRLMVMQIQLTRHQDVVPFTRDYVAERTASLKDLEAERLTRDEVIAG